MFRRNKFLSLILLLLLSVSFIACSSGETDEGEYSISGQIIDEEEQAVEDVSISFQGVLTRGKNVDYGVAKTDEEGRFSKDGLLGLVKITPV